ncbi:MAG: hypothetical protein ACKOX2_17040 [Microcystaceae cyanobacterium]
MADNEKTTLATFNVGSEDWESFKVLAKKDGRPASYYLNQFIKQSISRGSFEVVGSDIKPISDIDLSGVESLVNESVKSAIASLASQFSELKKEVEDLKKSEPIE